jgi:hypothetical protein
MSEAVSTILITVGCLVLIVFSVYLLNNSERMIAWFVTKSIWNWKKPSIGEYYARNNDYYKSFADNPFDDLHRIRFAKVIDIKEGYVLYKTYFPLEYKFGQIMESSDLESCSINDFMDKYTIPSAHAKTMILSKVNNIHNVVEEKSDV